MWIAMPEGTSWLSPGFSVSGWSRQARRSRPAAPGVPYWGRISRVLASRILTSSFLTSAPGLRQHARDVRHKLARELELGALAQGVAALRVVEGDRVVVGAERVLRAVGGDEGHALLRALRLRV